MTWFSSVRAQSIKDSLKFQDFVEHFYDGSGEVRSIYQSSMVGEVPGILNKNAGI